MKRRANDTPISEKLDALEAFTAKADGLIPAETIIEGQGLYERASTRLRHGSGHVVVALAGPTGAGKSSLFNAIVGEDVANVDVRRPTTSVTQAAIWGDQADELLDWLGIARRHYVGATPAVLDDATAEGHRLGEDVEGLVVVDLPDYDSVETAHRSEVDRLIAQVDALIWVVDPQKYADDALHRGYLQPLAAYGEIMRFVLSKTDTLDPDERQRCIDDLRQLVSADGIADPNVVGISVLTGAGMSDLSAELVSIAKEKVHVVGRVEADLINYGETIPKLRGEPGAGAKKRADAQLVEGLAAAAGVGEVSTNVRERYRQKATRTIGWPPLRMWARRRVDPELAIVDAGVTGNTKPQVRLALRNYGDTLASEVEEPVASAIRSAAIGSEESTVERLDNLGYGLRDELKAPRWWSLAAGLQWLAFAAAVAGVVWLVLLFVIESFLRVRVEEYTPYFEGAPLPTWMVLGGLVAGAVLTFLLRIVVSIGGRKRARRSRGYVVDQAKLVAQEVPITNVSEVTQRANECHRLLGTFSRAAA